MYFSKASLSQKADFKVNQSGNAGQNENVKACLFLSIEICPNPYMRKPNPDA